MKLWDPHFHIWDASAGVDDAGYSLADYERDIASGGFELIGGTFVEVMSARHAGMEGQGFADACAAEADWVSRQLGGGRLPYVMVASAPLEYDGVPVVIDHLGTPTTADLSGEVYWEGMRALADCPHTAIKLSMLPYVDGEWDTNAMVTESILRVIDLFGVERCFFASNFPVDLKSRWPAARLFGAFARLVSGMPEADRQRLFADNAMRAYGAADRNG